MISGLKNEIEKQEVEIGKIHSIPTYDELPVYDTPAVIRRHVKLNEDLSEDIKSSEEKTEDDDLGLDDFKFDDDYNKPAFLRRQMD